MKIIRHTIQLLNRISPRLTASLITHVLAAIPPSYRRSAREIEQLKTAKCITYKSAKGKHNVAWCWGEGPTVYVVHGWASRGSQMATLAQAIANAGYPSTCQRTAILLVKSYPSLILLTTLQHWQTS